MKVILASIYRSTFLYFQWLIIKGITELSHTDTNRGMNDYSGLLF